MRWSVVGLSGTGESSVGEKVDQDEMEEECKKGARTSKTLATKLLTSCTYDG
jgi:hypothetical protein